MIYKGAEIHLTEWNSSPSPRDLIHDTPFEAPFLLYNITQNFGKIDSLGYWAFTDIFEENGPGEEEFHGGFGLITNNGLKKPSYWAYYFLSKLGDEVIELSDRHIITRQGDNYQVIIWNYCYYTDEFAKGDRSKLTLTDRDNVFEVKDEKFNISLNLYGEYKLTEYTIDKDTSALHNWVKLDAPKHPSRNEIYILDAMSQPKVTASSTDNFNIDITLKPHEVKMYILEK